MLAGESLAAGVSTERIADLTEGCSGSDLRQICTAAAMRPVRELLRASGKSAWLASKVGSSSAFDSICRTVC
jgi:SpoVK/Ycf46/Vps4 family AAA+-type ATPase